MGFLNDLFAAIYENWFGVWDQGFRPIFAKLYKEGGYVNMGLIFFFIPIVMMAVFYFLWNYPYGKLWHWLVWLAFILLVVFVSTIVSANGFLAEYLLDPETMDFTTRIIRSYAWINTFLALIVSLVFSLIFKLRSKIQTHLPL